MIYNDRAPLLLRNCRACRAGFRDLRAAILASRPSAAGVTATVGPTRARRDRNDQTAFMYVKIDVIVVMNVLESKNHEE